MSSSASTGIPPKAPTILCDDSGIPIVPTVVPPVTEFPCTPQKNDPMLDSSNQLNGQGNDTSPHEYFGAQHEQQTLPEDTTVAATDHALTPTAGMQRRTSEPGKTQRPSVERGWQSERPKPAPRRSTLTNVLKRRSTAQPLEGTRGPFSYRFDPESSGSDSSSSSEDEETTKRRKKFKRNQKQVRADSERGYSRFSVGNDHFRSKGRVSKRDGRLNISVNEAASSGYIAKALGQSLKHHLNIPHHHKEDNLATRDNLIAEQNEAVNTDEGMGRMESGDLGSVASSVHSTVKRPRLNIVVMVIGSRGDIQPFMQIGRVLKQYGHRVRIATHPAFKEFVEKDVGLEFFSVGGNPSELMAFMVKNPGLIPSMDTVRQGEIARRRNQMAEMFEGFWRACVNATDDEKDNANLKLLGNRAPFIADAIIANPPSFAHIHIAERLGVPLHIMFTFPYSPTQAFPHPLANIRAQKSNVDPNYVNFMSYALVEMMTWQGLGDLINRFRVKTLGLEPVSSLWAPGALNRMKVPFTYLWSPGLAAKPKDWGPEIDIAGYVFLDLASNFKPPKDLEDFLNAGEPPIYIGFGSIVVDDPDKFTKLIFDAVKMAGVRALVSKGWGGLGDDDNTPDYIFMLENTPHDWLFPRVKAVVHHGGAGTAAIGLKCAKPTMVVPFFGDQPFWGAMIASKKAGAHEAVPYKKLTAEKLAEGIKQCLTKEAQENVQEIADSINAEGDGAENAVKSFHRSLPFAGEHNMRCSILEDRVAVWKLKHSNLRLSAIAAELLVESKRLHWRDMRLLRHYEWNDFGGPGEPITGIGSALVDTTVGFSKGLGMVPVNMAKHIRKREEHERRKRERMQRKEEKRKSKVAAKKEMEEEEKDQPHIDGETSAQMSASRPGGLEHQDTSTTLDSKISADPSEPLAQELAVDAGRGLLTSIGAIASAPLDLGLAIAQGFHNAPRLYGDASVRRPVRVTGMHSGAKAARNEFAYGIYDGWTGLVSQPMHGWQDGTTKMRKVSGLSKGFAKGVGGFVLKDVTAIISPPVMLAQGVKKEVVKRVGGPGTTSFIRKAHIIQGQKDLGAIQEFDKKHGTQHLEEMHQAVDHGWRVMKEVWHEKEDHIRHHGGAIRGRLSLNREQNKWLQNGALENINAADRALKTKKEGKDLNKMFAQRKKEMQIAEEPRASAMDQPVGYEEGPDVAPNGRYKHQPRRSQTHQEHMAQLAKQGSKNEAQKEATGAIDASGQTDTRTSQEKREDRHMEQRDEAEQQQTGSGVAEDHDDDTATSDTAVETPAEQDNNRRLEQDVTSDGKKDSASNDEHDHLQVMGDFSQLDYKRSPAGHLNDTEIGKHDADRLAGKGSIAA